MKKIGKKKIIVLVIITAIIIAIIVPYIPIEYRTFMYGKEFTNEYEQTNMIGGADYLKVFKYSSNYAKILYVSSDAKCFVYFMKDENKWVMDYWECVWSSRGSADDFTFPYY